MTPSASHRTDLAQPVTVELWVVVCAIRYGTGRMTYANADAVSLALTHWQALPGFIRDQIVRDAQSLPDGYERQAWQPVIDLQDGHPTGDTPTPVRALGAASQGPDRRRHMPDRGLHALRRRDPHPRPRPRPTAQQHPLDPIDGGRR